MMSKNKMVELWRGHQSGARRCSDCLPWGSQSARLPRQAVGRWGKDGCSCAASGSRPMTTGAFPAAREAEPQRSGERRSVANLTPIPLVRWRDVTTADYDVHSMGRHRGPRTNTEQCLVVRLFVWLCGVGWA